MAKFVDWIHVVGRGWIATFEMDDIKEPLPKVGETVTIEGHNYHCVGVEQAIHPMSIPIPTKKYGVIIRGDPVREHSAE